MICDSCLLLGLAAEGDPDAVGEPHHGHTGISCTCHGVADRRDVETKTVRTHKAADLTDDDEEHYWSFCLPADHHLHHSVCRYRLYLFLDFVCQLTL